MCDGTFFDSIEDLQNHYLAKHSAFDEAGTDSDPTQNTDRQTEPPNQTRNKAESDQPLIDLGSSTASSSALKATQVCYPALALQQAQRLFPCQHPLPKTNLIF